MSSLTYIPNRVLDINGVADGASIYVYQSGTTTPISLYLDKACTVPTTNPYVVALGAAVPTLYYNYTGDIRRRVVSLSGSVDDQDPYAHVITSTDITYKTFQDFGAKGDATVTGGGTDDTAAIQAAINWAGGAQARAIYMSHDLFLCGNITIPPYVTIVGGSRQCSGFVVKTGTTGKWFTDNGSATKICLENIVFYCRSLTGLTDGVNLGNNVTPHGSEGILRNLWIRDAVEGYGLNYNGNVGFVDTITLQNCKFPLKARGSANHFENIVCMQAGVNAAVKATAIGADLSAAYIRGLHIEAPADGSKPLLMTGDCHVKDLMISNTAGNTFSHLIEVDTTNYVDWSIEGMRCLPNPSTVTITNGCIKIGSSFFGGTNPVAFSGSNWGKARHVTSGELTLRYAQLQMFRVFITNTAGTLQHRIGSSTSSATSTGNYNNKINNASITLTNTPTGGSAFMAGASISSGGLFTLDTAGVPTNADVQAIVHVGANTTGTALTAMAFVAPVTIGGVSQNRLYLQLYNETTGAAVPITTANIPAGTSVYVTVWAWVL